MVDLELKSIDDIMDGGGCSLVGWNAGMKTSSGKQFVRLNFLR